MLNLLKVIFNKNERYIELDGTPTGESTTIGRLARPWLIATAIVGGVIGTYVEKPTLIKFEIPPYGQALLGFAFVALVKRQALRGAFNNISQRYVIDTQPETSINNQGLLDTAPLMLIRSGFLGLPFIYILSGGNHIAFAIPIIADALYDGYISGRVVLGSWNVVPRNEMTENKKPEPK
jgi:hypothetical protein